MREEQTPDREVAEHPWHEGPDELLRELCGGGAALAADFPSGSGPDLSAEISPLRYVLDLEAIERYRRLGADAVAAVKEMVDLLSSETYEIEASAFLVAACRRRGIFTPVLMAVSGERMGRYRHVIPCGGPLGRRVMLVVRAERGGLFANHTRLVNFDTHPSRASDMIDRRQSRQDPIRTGEHCGRRNNAMNWSKKLVTSLRAVPACSRYRRL